MNRNSLTAGILIVLLAGLPAWAGSKKAKDLDKVSGETEVEVIVRFRGSVDSTKVAKTQGNGGAYGGDLAVVRGAKFRIKGKDIDRVAADPDVEYVAPNRKVEGVLDYAARAAATESLFSSGWTGKGVGIAVLDSGIANKVKDFFQTDSKSSRIVYEEDFTGDKGEDKFGHGSHVAGIVGGNGSVSSGKNSLLEIRGIAPEVNLISLKVLDDKGAGSDGSVIAAIERAIQLKNQYNIRVINLSLGRPVFESYTEDPLCRAVERAWKAGIVVVAAAGNMGRDNTFGTSGYGTITSPGNSPYVITVGAMRTMDTKSLGDDAIASYSSKGPTLIDQIVKPDIVAPGNLITSVSASEKSGLAKDFGADVAVDERTYRGSGSSRSKDYIRLSGTSMATPMVSGVIALMIQKEQSLSPDQIKARLMKTASKNLPTVSISQDPKTGQTFTNTHDLFTVGAGYMDASAALSSTDRAIGPAYSPRVVLDPSTGQVKLSFDSVSGANLVWGTNIVWGTNVVWGTNIVWGTNVVWGTNIVWGTASMSGFNIVWGTESPWSTNVVWGSSEPSVSAMRLLVNGEK